MELTEEINYNNRLKLKKNVENGGKVYILV